MAREGGWTRDSRNARRCGVYSVNRARCFRRIVSASCSYAPENEACLRHRSRNGPATDLARPDWMDFCRRDRGCRRSDSDVASSRISPSVAAYICPGDPADRGHVSYVDGMCGLRRRFSKAPAGQPVFAFGAWPNH